MQLHAFLASFRQHVTSPGSLYVLFTTSPAHAASYEKLISEFPDPRIIFVREHNFKRDLVNLVNRIAADRVALYVDDIIFTRPVDLTEVLDHDPLFYHINLGRGEDLSFSVVLNKPQALPTLHPFGNSGWIWFRWNELPGYHDWAFPLGVGGYVYDRVELLLMLEELDYKAPNSLEIAMQSYLDFFIDRKGVCKRKSVLVGVPANLVQTENDSRVVSHFTTEYLLDQWNKGMQIDVVAYYDKPADEAQIQLYTFVPRTGVQEL